jgi:hypothetical protein
LGRHRRPGLEPGRRLDQIVRLFFTDHVFGPDRAALLAAQLPATDAAARTDRDAQTAAIQTRLRQIDTAQSSCILELEQLAADPADTAAAAMRGRIRARFGERGPGGAQSGRARAAGPGRGGPGLASPRRGGRSWR